MLTEHVIKLHCAFSLICLQKCLLNRRSEPQRQYSTKNKTNVSTLCVCVCALAFVHLSRRLDYRLGVTVEEGSCPS